MLYGHNIKKRQLFQTLLGQIINLWWYLKVIFVDVSSFYVGHLFKAQLSVYRGEQARGKDKFYQVYDISFETGSELKDISSLGRNFLGYLFSFIFKVRLQANLSFNYSIAFLLNDCS